jgi:hypothetical protein
VVKHNQAFLKTWSRANKPMFMKKIGVTSKPMRFCRHPSEYGMEPSKKLLDRFNDLSAVQIASVGGMTPVNRLVEMSIAKEFSSFSFYRGKG